jgi:hypothetical protein
MKRRKIEIIYFSRRHPIKLILMRHRYVKNYKDFGYYYLLSGFGFNSTKNTKICVII